MIQQKVPSTKILDSVKTQAGYNVEMLEGAVLHVLQICGGCLSAASLDRFGMIYAYKHGKQFQPNYVSNSILPRMRNENRLCLKGNEQNKYYTINPIIGPDRQVQDAFWVFLEFMDETDLQTVGAGPRPAQITFSRRGRTYHIISVKDNGNTEFQDAVNYELKIEKAKSKGVKRQEERFIFIFNSMDLLRNANFQLHSKTMYCAVTYNSGSLIPILKFVSPGEN